MSLTWDAVALALDDSCPCKEEKHGDAREDTCDDGDTG